MRTLKEQKLNKCRHFNGTINKECEAGVKYAAVLSRDANVAGRNLPCFRDSANPCECPSRQWKTEEEVDREVEEADRRFEATRVAREAIVKHLGGPWEGGAAGASGAIPCPVCLKGELGFSRSGYNGHIHARCGTEGCVAWME